MIIALPKFWVFKPSGCAHRPRSLNVWLSSYLLYYLQELDSSRLSRNKGQGVVFVIARLLSQLEVPLYSHLVVGSHSSLRTVLPVQVELRVCGFEGPQPMRCIIYCRFTLPFLPALMLEIDTIRFNTVAR